MPAGPVTIYGHLTKYGQIGIIQVAGRQRRWPWPVLAKVRLHPGELMVRQLPHQLYVGFVGSLVLAGATTSKLSFGNSRWSVPTFAINAR